MKKKGQRLWCLLLSVALSLTSVISGDSAFQVQAATTAVTPKLRTGALLTKGVKCTQKSKTAIENASIENVSDIAGTPSAVQELLFEAGTVSKVNHYGYDQLSDEQQALYDDADQAFTAYVSGSTYQTTDYTTSSVEYDASNKVYVAFSLEKSFADYGLTTYEGLQVYFTYRNNNPQYYWIDTTYYTTATKFTVLLDDYYIKASKRLETDQNIADGLEEYTKLANKYSSTYDKVKAVHDKLIDEVEYAYKSGSSSTPETAIWAHSAAGVFCDLYNGGKGVVCEGYAKAFELILQNLDIENIYILGTGNGSGHAWNAVKLDDNQYYYVDVTWDDAGADKEDGRRYVYFCTPKTYYEKKHKTFSSTSKSISTWLYALPKNIADTMDYTYYEQYSSHFTNISGTAEVDSLLRVAAAKEAAAPGPQDTKYFHILCDTASDALLVIRQLGISYYYPYSGYGYVVVAPKGNYAVTTPATSISLNKTSAAIDRNKETLTLKASLTPSGSDDIVQWSVTGDSSCYLSNTTGTETTVTFGGNGNYTVTAATLVGSAKASCKVTVTNSAQYQDGTDLVDFTLWANGKTYMKQIDLTDQLDGLTATNWTKTNAKGKTITQKGKIGWLSLRSPLSGTDGYKVPFNTTKHTITTRASSTDKAMATVNTKGLLTIKEPGTVYAYAYDTGSCTSKEIKITSSIQEMQKKTHMITPNLTATNWKNAKGKEQKGKIVWIAKKEQTAITFNSSKHTVTTKMTAEDKKIGTVNAKGMVTAKSAGMLYVYACDTGSMMAEEYVVKIKNAPSSIKFSTNLNSINKKDIRKNLSVTVGTGKTSVSSGNLNNVTNCAYVIGAIGQKIGADADTTYQVNIPEKYQEYIDYELLPQGNGNYLLNVWAKDNETTQAMKKQIKISVTVACIQSMRKASIPVTVRPK